MSCNIISTTEEQFQKIYMNEKLSTNNYYIDNLKHTNQSFEYQVGSNTETNFIDSDIQQYFLPLVDNQLENREYINVHEIIKLKNHIEVSRYKKTIAKLQEYKKLPLQWDGYEAEIPNYDDINNCIVLVNLIYEKKLKIPKPMIASDGEISLFWEYNDNYMEIGFIENKYSFYIDINGTEICSQNSPIEEIDYRILFEEIVKFS